MTSKGVWGICAKKICDFWCTLAASGGNSYGKFFYYTIHRGFGGMVPRKLRIWDAIWWHLRAIRGLNYYILHIVLNSKYSMSDKNIV